MSKTDPYNHLLTTNQWNPWPLSNVPTYNTIFSDPHMTLVNNHVYFKDCSSPINDDLSLAYFTVFSGSDIRNSWRFNKPNNDGEGGITPCGGTGGASPFNDQDPQGVIIKG